MKKYLLLLLLVFALCPSAKAQKLDIQEIIQSSITVLTVSCSSSTPTLMDSSTTVTAMQNRSFVAFQTQDTSNYACIGFNANMTCASGSIIVPENRAIVSIPLSLWKGQGAYHSNGLFNIWCLTSSTTGPSSVTLIQGF